MSEINTERYYLHVQLTNAEGEDASKVESVYMSNLEGAISAFMGKCKTLHTATDVYYAVVELKDWYGNIVGGKYTETIDHTPIPTTYIAITDVDAIAEEGVTYYVFINNQYVEDTGVKVGDRVYGKYVVLESAS